MPRFRIPNLIVAGVPRASTSSLFSYLARHPDICASSNKETNYFLPLMYNKPVADLDDYSTFFAHCKNDVRYILEASPRYLYGKGNIAGRIATDLNQAKVIILLRDPTERLYSFFNHRKKSGKVAWDRTFETHVSEAIAEYESMPVESGNNLTLLDKFDRGLVQGIYVDYLHEWLYTFGANLRVCFFEDLVREPTVFMVQLSKWLGIDPTPYQDSELNAENKTNQYRSKAFLSFARTVNDKFISKLGPLRNHVKDSLVKIHDLVNTSTNKNEAMRPETQQRLREFYSPHNARLNALLNDRKYDNFPDWLN